MKLSLKKSILQVWSLALMLSFFTCLKIQAQSQYVPLWNPAYNTIDRVEIKGDSISSGVHTSVKPYSCLRACIAVEDADDHQKANYRSRDRQMHFFVYHDNSEWSFFGAPPSKKPIFKKFYEKKTDFVYFNKMREDFFFKFNPIIQFELGKESGSDQIRYINTRGLELQGTLMQKLGFYTAFTENQIGLPSYIHDPIIDNYAIPGEGRFKEFSSMIGDDLFLFGWDYFSTRGYITFQPISNLDIQFGHDKNFIGNGFRSLILSDQSNSYLFLKSELNIWKIHYLNLFTELTGQFRTFGDGALPKKYMVLHHLSFNVNKWLNLGVFETIIYSRDTGFELQYLNPLIFYRALEFQLGSTDNVLVGLDWKANFARHFSFYGQLVIDEYSLGQLFDGSGWWGNKMAVQAGLKYVDVANISNLDLQVEFNMARPYIYSHYNHQANYTHYNQPLAHPLGANFREVMARLSWQAHAQLRLTSTLMYAQQGADFNTAEDTISYGGDIFRSNLEVTNYRPYGNELLQGDRRDILLGEFQLSYMWRHNLFMDLNYIYRREDRISQPTANSSHYIGLGMRLNMARKPAYF